MEWVGKEWEDSTGKGWGGVGVVLLFSPTDDSLKILLEQTVCLSLGWLSVAASL